MSDSELFFCWMFVKSSICFVQVGITPTMLSEIRDCAWSCVWDLEWCVVHHSTPVKYSLDWLSSLEKQENGWRQHVMIWNVLVPSSRFADLLCIILLSSKVKCPKNACTGFRITCNAEFMASGHPQSMNWGFRISLLNGYPNLNWAPFHKCLNQQRRDLYISIYTDFWCIGSGSTTFESETYVNLIQRSSIQLHFQ